MLDITYRILTHHEVINKKMVPDVSAYRNDQKWLRDFLDLNPNAEADPVIGLGRVLVLFILIDLRTEYFHPPITSTITNKSKRMAMN